MNGPADLLPALVARGGRLPPPETRILGLLIARAGSVVSRDAVAEAGGTGPNGAWSDSQVYLAICNIRACIRFAHLNVIISTIRGVGWRLDVQGGAA